MTHDMWHMLEDEHSLKISAPQLLWFGTDSALNIFQQTIAWVNELKSNKAVKFIDQYTMRKKMNLILNFQGEPLMEN